MRMSVDGSGTPRLSGTMEAEMIAGMDGGRFEPQQFVTRAQAATMLKRLLQMVDFIE